MITRRSLGRVHPPDYVRVEVRKHFVDNSLELLDRSASPVDLGPMAAKPWHAKDAIKLRIHLDGEKLVITLQVSNRILETHSTSWDDYGLTVGEP